MHDGLFLRMQVGVSETILKPAPDTTLTGPGSAIDLALGKAFWQRLVLAGAFTHAAGPLKAVGPANPPDLNSIFIGFGPAVIGYLPGNFFVGGAVGVARMQFESQAAMTTWKTALGVFMKVEGGKEWWVSANWGLGASLRLFVMRAGEANAGPYAPVWDAASASLLFSATYN